MPRPSDAVVAPSGTAPVEVLAATAQLSGVPGAAVSVDDIALGGRDDDGVHAAEAQDVPLGARRDVARARTAGSRSSVDKRNVVLGDARIGGQDRESFTAGL
jgi:hypothetical protein